MPIYLEKQAQIKVLLFNKAFISIIAKYLNYNNVFLVKNIVKLLKYIRMNDYVIKSEKSKQSLFKPIYSLKIIKLEILKTYIEINLANSFIWLFKFLIKIFIFFQLKIK